MSDIKLFRIDGRHVTEMEGHSVAVEKSLQTEIERNLDVYLGVTFLATEYSTGKTHRGRIDTLGIDENHCPVIIEYKRSTEQNVINQGLFYLDWLMDHKAEFELLVQRTLDQDAADMIDWSSPRLVCIAGGYTKYDEHAVLQIDRNIELISYRRFGDEFLLLELVNAVTADPISFKPKKSAAKYKTATEFLKEASPELLDLFENLKETLMNFGDDIQFKTLKLYFAFRKIRNFATVEIRPYSKSLVVYVKVNPDTIQLEEGFSRDVRKIGHWGTGDLELTLKSMADIEKARPLFIKSYEVS